MRELIAGRAALIVIDMQKGGFDPFEISGIPHHTDGYRERIARVAAVVDACHRVGLPVIFFQEIHRGLEDFGRELDGVEKVHCLEGDPGTDLVDELRPRPDDYFIQKRRYSCFLYTELDLLLRGLGIRTLLLVGNLTNVCVHYTFADAHQRDYHVRVLEDCVSGSDERAHIAALEAMEYLQTGARRTSGEVLAALRDTVPA